MSGTATNPWTFFADMLRQGVDSYVSTQKTLLDIAAQQNSLWMSAASQGFGVATPSGMTVLAGQSIRAFLESQKLGLDIALQQNKLALNLVKGALGGPARPYLDELANFLEQGAQTFVDAQKKLLEFAGQNAATMMQAAGNSNPLAQMAELSRQAVDAFIEAQKQFLDLISRQAAGAARPTEPATDFLNMARQSFDNYVNMQRQFLETAANRMADTTTLNNVARQGVEAFVTTQRAILDLMLRSLYPAGASVGQ
ncbi:MAG TPA: hypothetical protein VEU96_30415 [Bryobacteraceae bacterium]|nr:hypothetical protein [Bryobacteraceae bacterium]